MGPKIRYQQRPSELRETLWLQGHIDPLSLFRILAWKSAKGLASATTNPPGQIERVTGEVLSLLAPYRDASSPPADETFWSATHDALVGADGKTGLFGLDGLRIPTASAVLSILNPSVWPIIDRWAYAALFDISPHQASGRIGWFNNYRRYVERLIELLADHPTTTIHELDQQAMNAGMAGRSFP
jgi:hypothetical protein